MPTTVRACRAARLRRHAAPRLRRYPAEKEICFAPLTGVEVQGSRVDGPILVVEARLSVNLAALTIEEVVAKMLLMRAGEMWWLAVTENPQCFLARGKK